MAGTIEDIDHLVDWDSGTNTGISDVYFFGIGPNYSGLGIETFGGDGTGTTANWEYTLPTGVTVDAIFVDVPGDILTEVTIGAQTVGPEAADYPWTWANQSGALNSIGL